MSDKDQSDFVSRGGNTASDEPGELTIIDSNKLEWMPNVYEGDTQRFLKLKPMFIDPAAPDNNNTGFVSMVCWAPPGWSDNRMVHHPVFEEAYSTAGVLDYNFGSLGAGTYFFPPRPGQARSTLSPARNAAGPASFRLDGFSGQLDYDQ